MENKLEVVKKTEFGKILHCDSKDYILTLEDNSIDLIVTSPPYDLIAKKSYGNYQDDEYIAWLLGFGKEFYRVLKDTGSLVIDLGGSWNKGYPTKNLYEYRVLLKFCDELGFLLAQDFFWWDPSKLPNPTEWVNKRRVRVKDAVNKIWWLSKTHNPKANNKNILQKYSASMEYVLNHGTNTGNRASGHQVTDNFEIDNRGAIPPNFIAMANNTKDHYTEFCEKHDIKVHPARFASVIPEFFIRMLTDENDVILDPFAGSCITGEVAEKLKRNWVCCDKEMDFLTGALGRFQKGVKKHKRNKSTYVMSSPSFELYEEDEKEILINKKQLGLNL